MVDGTCFNIWLKDTPDDLNIKLLRKYTEHLRKRMLGSIFLRFGKPKINWIGRIQILIAIGYVPKFEIKIFGGLYCIFLASEAIMRKYNGYYDFGVPIDKSKPKHLRGKCYTYYSPGIRFNRPEIQKKYITDAVAFGEYYNSIEDEDIRKLYTFPDELF